MKQIAAVAAALVFIESCASIEVVSPTGYQPAHSVSGVIRVWGNGEMTALVRRWEAGFRKYHPGARIEANLTGSDVAMAGLYTGLADVALLGRESTASEGKAFEWIFGYQPASVEIMTGSLDRPGRSPALVAFVHQDNPLSRITLVQLDAVFGQELLHGATRNIRTWGELGLPEEWADAPINLYTFDSETGSGRFFRRVVLGDSRKMNWERLTEFQDSRRLRDPTHDASRKILDALATDRFGLAVASGPAPPGTRPLALAFDAGGNFWVPTRDTLVSRDYPLTRSAYAYFNVKPDAPLDSKLSEFLGYVLSRDGQQDVDADAQYLPLSEEAVHEQRRRLR